MPTVATILFSLIAFLWIVQGVRAGIGMSKIPRLSQAAPATDDALPRMSILFAARDEAEKLPAALQSLLLLNYPDYEIIAVDDRSQDATARILDEFARTNSRLKVAHIAELPHGWLGKPHALQAGYELASGEWFVFTDADVRFSPDLLRRAYALARCESWDHLTLLTALELHGFWETATVAYLGLGFLMGFQPWRVSDPKSGSYFGVGAFQLVRRAAYEAIGMHRKLAMEVVDDIKLGKLIKLGGFRSGLAASETFVQLRWQDGFSNLVRGLMKNLFAGFRFRVFDAAISVVAVFTISILPFIGVWFVHGAARIACIISALVAVALEGRLVRETHKSPLYGLSHPIGAAVFIYMVVRSVFVTLRRGGIVWRETFYPLDELRKGMV